MCGIVGFLNSSKNYSDQKLVEIITEMSFALKHRGPDDQGVWVDAESKSGCIKYRTSWGEVREEAACDCTDG